MPISSPSKKRSEGACDFCRKRKLGCDNARPKCTHCKERKIACVFSKRAQKARPSNARIRELEQQNIRLRRSLRSSDNTDLGIEPTSVDHPDSLPSPFSQHIETSRNHVSPVPARQHLYSAAGHGFPTISTVAASAEISTDVLSLTMAEQKAQNQLVANTTKQRQLEPINVASGKLDFENLDPQVGMDILCNFWNRQHYIGSVVYRPSFMRDMANGGKYYSKLLLNALLFSGSKHYSTTSVTKWPQEVQYRGRAFRHRFEEILNEPGQQRLFKSNITTIQALLVVSDALFSWCDEPSLSWHYMGIAINMIVDLGLHVEASAGAVTEKTAEDLEVQRRVFWAAFAMDKVQSIYQGRPARLREADNRMSIKFLDDYEELELFYTVTFSEKPCQLGCPTYSISTFEQLCKLSIIMDRILCHIYSEKSSLRSAQDLMATAKSLQYDLESWREAMPKHLAVRLEDPAAAAILPHTLSLLAMYNSSIILLHRPFVSDGHLQSVSASAASDAFSACATAAIEVHRTILLYKQHFCLKTVPHFVSYATYVSATIHVRMAAQAPPGSSAHGRLRACLDTLNLQRENCLAPEKTLRILLGLANRLGVDVGGIAILQAPSCLIDRALALGVDQSQDAERFPQHPSVAMEDEGRTVTTQQEPPQDMDFDLGTMWEDFNIDEIMKSFDIPPNYSELPLPDSSATHHGGTIGVHPDAFSAQNGSMDTQEPVFLPDFLFGLNMDMGQ